MKLIRLSLLMVILVVTFLATPEAFGAKQRGGSLAASKGKMKYPCYDIYCHGIYSDGCCGTVEECLVVCDERCNLTPGTCVFVQ